MAVINGNDRPNNLFGTNAADLIRGFGSGDVLQGQGGNDAVYGGYGGDYLSGGTGRDTLNGGPGKDILYGGAGPDLLTGGPEQDIFRYASPSDSRRSTGIDVITDFRPSQNDKIDLRLIDGGNGTFIGQNGFDGTAGEVNYRVHGGNTFVSADLNGDARADFTVELRGAYALNGGDFQLF